MKYGGKCNLRFDDTNPTKEDVEYVDSIMEDVQWLGFSWDDRVFYASDYFEQLYEWAVQLIKEGQGLRLRPDADEIREYRGTLTKPGKDSPVPRSRRRGEPRPVPPHEGRRIPRRARTLRAKIDMASPNFNMRDPVMYRILHAEPPPHRRQVVHLSDVRLGPRRSPIPSRASPTRSARWSSRTIGRSTTGTSRTLGIYHPQQIEFARLNLDLHGDEQAASCCELVRGEIRQRLGRSAHADDLRPAPPRLHARGAPHVLRTHRRGRSSTASSRWPCWRTRPRGPQSTGRPRVMAVLNPLKVVIDNYPEGQVEELDAVNNPEDPSAGTRKVPFSRGALHRAGRLPRGSAQGFLPPGSRAGGAAALRLLHQVRLGASRTRQTGEITELHCTYDPATRGGNAPDGRKVKGTIHWVSAQHAVDAEVRLYDHLFTKPDPDDVPEGQDYKVNLNPNSLTVGHAASSSRAWRTRAGRQPLSSSSGSATSASTRRTRARGAGLQPHGDAPRHLGQDREENGEEAREETGRQSVAVNAGLRWWRSRLAGVGVLAAPSAATNWGLAWRLDPSHPRLLFCATQTTTRLKTAIRVSHANAYRSPYGECLSAFIASRLELVEVLACSALRKQFRSPTTRYG